MQSQINFVDSHTLTPKPDVTAGQILVSSKDLPWDGVYIEKGENEEFTPEDVTVPQHYFAMNTGPAFEWEWKDGKTV
jgi:AraC family transcriptional regulator